MDSKKGLIVPNVKNCESKSILEIAADLQAILRDALGGSVKPDDIRGGTFTISNIGSVSGILYPHGTNNHEKICQCFAFNIQAKIHNNK